MPSEMSLEAWQEREFGSTSLKANFGRILCIGYLRENQPMTGKAEILTGIETMPKDKSLETPINEKKLLKDFWKIAEGINLFVGHNILDFDLKFIWKRSVICEIKPTIDVSFRRYYNNPVLDTMQEWDKWDSKGYTSLDTLAKILDFPTSKNKLDGSKVQSFYEQRRFKEIYDYCKADVELTRKIYYRMRFIS